MSRLRRRLYQIAGVEKRDGAWLVLLDGRPVRTPAKADLALPVEKLAEAVAEEWRRQGERVDPENMPLTKLANSAIDQVAAREEAVARDILAYAATDLLCYRAERPEGLVVLQAQHWDPVLAWVRETFHAPLVLGQGVSHVTQPAASLEHIAEALDGLSAFELAALHVMTTLSGSALLALAVAKGRLSPEQAWAAAHVDEDWQISQWGEDAEGAARRARRWRDFEAAAQVLRLLR